MSTTEAELKRRHENEVERLLREQGAWLRETIEDLCGQTAGEHIDRVEEAVRRELWRTLNEAEEARQVSRSRVHATASVAALDELRHLQASGACPQPAAGDEGDRAERAAAGAALRQRIERLPTSRRTAIKLHLQGFHATEVASFLGWNVRRTGPRLQRALRAVRGGAVDGTSWDPLGVRSLYVEQTRRHGDRDQCPTPAALLELSRGDADAEERRRCGRHMADCSDCSGEYRSLQRHPLQEWSSTATPRQDALRPFNRTLHRWCTVAATTGLLLTLAMAFWQTSLLTTIEAGAAKRPDGDDADLPQPPPYAVLGEPPALLAWPADPSAADRPQRFDDVPARYRVRLFDPQGALLDDATLLAQNSYLLPGAVRERLSAGGRFLWTVDSALQRIGPLWFEIRVPTEGQPAGGEESASGPPPLPSAASRGVG
ncbi:MAG: hypothetical protein DWQ36_02510 [Acidobacteria bacterium]|nr:MAG: hypothetical protein DWQ30_23900 [Acidobacteriota bacterium]REK11313.1 MAG: hypothetical protein DWQ36_02510 [Acidobacteriota bacterium]